MASDRWRHPVIVRPSAVVVLVGGVVAVVNVLLDQAVGAGNPVGGILLGLGALALMHMREQRRSGEFGGFWPLPVGVLTIGVAVYLIGLLPGSLTSTATYVAAYASATWLGCVTYAARRRWDERTTQ